MTDMAQFATETRLWLEAVIKQRKVLLRMGKSFKPEAEVRESVSVLEQLLGAYRYENDLHMARFIRQNTRHIDNILPGSGSTCARKKNLEFNDINYKAVQIIAGSISFRKLEILHSQP